MKVLIADDDLEMRSLLCAELQDEGYLVCQVGDGQDALDCLQQFRPDLVLTDLRMPEGGMRLVARLLQQTLSGGGIKDDHASSLGGKSQGRKGLTRAIAPQPRRIEVIMRGRNACLSFLLGVALVWALAAAHVGAASGEFPAEQLYEGSAEQKAYSEFNHRLSGAVLLVIGGLFALQERRAVTRRWLALWPFGLLFLAGYLVVWSDHDAWPIGPQSFAQTFFSGDLETVQHKLYAVVLFALGALEWARLEGRAPQWGNLVFFGIVGFAGLLMLHHSHLMAHNHHSPALLSDHVLLGVLTIGSAGVKLAWERRWMTWRHGGLLWPGSVLLIGGLLVLYTE